MRLARRGGRIELVGEGTQPLGDDPVGTGAGFLELAAGLLLGVVDHLRRGALGRLDDRRQALSRAAGQRARLRWSLCRTHRRVAYGALRLDRFDPGRTETTSPPSLRRSSSTRGGAHPAGQIVRFQEAELGYRRI